MAQLARYPAWAKSSVVAITAPEAIAASGDGGWRSFGAVMLPTHAPTISLSPAAADDVAFLSALANDPGVEPFLAPGAGDADALWALVSDAGKQRGPHGLFVIRSPEDEPQGGLVLRVVNHRSRICELARLMVRPDKRRAGIAYAAVRLACRKVFVDDSFHRLQLEVYGDNVAAQALFRRVGFVHEGTRRRAYWRRERWLDGVQFGMLAEEFRLEGASV